MTTKAHRERENGGVPARAGAVAVLDQPDARPDHERLLQFQRDAGNAAVCQLLGIQRETATKPRVKPKQPQLPKSERNDVIDFLTGFQELAVAVDKGGARGAYGPKFGPDLSDEHRATLERVRRVLIKSQGDKAARRAAQTEWPTLVAKLMAGVDAGRRLKIPAGQLTVMVDNIDAVGDRWVKTGGVKTGTVDSVSQFTDGVRQLVEVIDQTWYDLTSGVVPSDIAKVNISQQAALKAVKFAPGLSKRHLGLLEQLRKALILARTRGSAKESVAIWKTIGADIVVTLETQKAGDTKNLLLDIGQKLVQGGLYSEKHNAALTKVTLADPREGIAASQLRAVAKDLIVAKDIADKAIALGAGASMGAFFKAAGMSEDLGGAIWDLAKNPGEAAGKLEEFKKKGLLSRSATTADLLDKVLGLRQAVYSISLNSIKAIAEREGKKALAKGAVEMVAKWKGVGEWATKHLDVLSKVGSAAIVVGIAVSIIKIADAIDRGDYAAAFQEAINAGLQAGAAVAGGAAGGAMFAAIGVIIAAEIEGISGAAAMIRWAGERNVKEAALDFIHICEDAASIEAKAMLADMQLLDDPDLIDQHAEIKQRLASHLVWWNRHVDRMQTLYLNDRVNALGGQPRLKLALGDSAVGALFGPPPDSLAGLGRQVRDVFAGANKMSKYVGEKYGPKK